MANASELFGHPTTINDLTEDHTVVSRAAEELGFPATRSAVRQGGQVGTDRVNRGLLGALGSLGFDRQRKHKIWGHGRVFPRTEASNTGTGNGGNWDAQIPPALVGRASQRFP